MSFVLQIKDRAAEGRAYCNLGNTYRALGELDKVRACARQPHC